LRPYLQLIVESASSLSSAPAAAATDSSSSSSMMLLSNEVVRILKWAKDLRAANDPSDVTADKDEGKGGGEEDNDDAREKHTKRLRRGRLRAYIASVKIMFEIWFQTTSSSRSSSCTSTTTDEINRQMKQYIPSPQSMLYHWEKALNLGSNPADGGQKEVLPGDDLILLTAQLLLYRSSSSLRNKDHPELSSRRRHHRATCILAVALYERAIIESPFNPYLKIAALNLYSRVLGGTIRAWEIFETVDIRQVQLDSCSYLILPHLIQGGLYTEAIQQSRNIISLHSSSGKDVGNYMGKSFENGNLEKGQEMIVWQRVQMRESLQLLHAKGLIMDLAPLLYEGPDNGIGGGGGGTTTTEGKSLDVAGQPSPLGGLHGVCGGESDIPRAEKMVHDSDIYYAAPSLLRLSSHPIKCSSSDISSRDNGGDGGGEITTRPVVITSDNRDLTINQFEILIRTNHNLPTAPSILRSHIHGIIVRTILVVSLSRPPKRGKIVAYHGNDAVDPLEKRSRSLLRAINRAQEYCNEKRLAEEDVVYDDVSDVGGDGGGLSLPQDHHLRNAIFTLAQIVSAVTTGLTKPDSSPTTGQNDTLKTREATLLPLLEDAAASISSARQASLSSSSASSTTNNNNTDDNDEYGNRPLSAVSNTLANNLVTVFTLVKTVGNLFTSFGWGKRKRSTKKPAGGLADVAVALFALVGDYLAVVKAVAASSDGMINVGDEGEAQEPEQQGMIKEEMVRRTLECLSIKDDGAVVIDKKEGKEDMMELMRYLDTERSGSGSDSGKVMLERVVGHLVRSRECTKGRVRIFLVQMAEELKTFDVS